MSEALNYIIQNIPHQPGCYKYYSAENELLYVGKAKDLKKRVSSYFNKTIDNYKTRKLVSLIQHIEFTITDNEHDAFLLENSLIKHYQPRYNISLKDDKTYPYIVIKNEAFPRVFLTRKLVRDKSDYLGPFTGVNVVRDLLELVKQHIPLRTCNLDLSPENIAKKKFKVCLEYHLGNCKGPCEGLQTEDEYAEDVQATRHILKGNTGEVLKLLQKDMEKYAADMKFEKAEIIKRKIESLQHYQSKSTVVNPRLNNVDVACILNDEHVAYVNYMMVSNGSVICAKAVTVEKKLEETDSEILSIVVANMRETFCSNATEVIAPVEIEVPDVNMTVTIPLAGDKKKLLDLCIKNAEYFRLDVRKKNSLLLEQSTIENDKRVLEQLQEALRLPQLPVHIECFDNSNFQGSHPVAAMVCFRDGIASKNDYRHFHIKTVKGIDDFASMSEVVYRRYSRLAQENKPLPQLVIIDGGKGHLSAALESIEKLGLTGKMTVVGLAKREESIFFSGDSEPLQLPYDSPAHLLIRRIRDEVHRFGVTFHRQVRSTGMFKNELEAIPGVGAKTAEVLLENYRTVSHVKTLTERELAASVGMVRARKIWAYFHNNENSKPIETEQEEKEENTPL
jgi:excinuclease ABC subunit C